MTSKEDVKIIHIRLDKTDIKLDLLDSNLLSLDLKQKELLLRLRGIPENLEKGTNLKDIIVTSYF